MPTYIVESYLILHIEHCLSSLYIVSVVMYSMHTVNLNSLIQSMADVKTRDVTIDLDANVTARLYIPSDTPTAMKLPILIYIHGGAFNHGSAKDPKWDNHLKSLTSQGHLLSVSIDYRLAPQHRLPAAYDDADPWVAEHGDLDRLFVAGDSAGANISHQVALRAGDNGVKIRGTALVDPYFWGEKPLPNETTNIVKRNLVLADWELAMPESTRWTLDHPWINPIAEGAPSLGRLGCKKLLVCVATEDDLQWRGKAYYQAAVKEMGSYKVVELFESKGGHDFHLIDPYSKEAIKLVNKLVSFFTTA